MSNKLLKVSQQVTAKAVRASDANVNLILGGDFNEGVTFASDYKLQKQANGAGTLGVVKAPPNWGMPNKSGRGGVGDAFLMVDGATDAKKAFWKQSVKLEKDQTYEFSFFVATNDAYLPLQLKVGGKDVGVYVASKTYANIAAGGNLHRHLRSQKSRHKSHMSGCDRRGKIPSRRPISERASHTEDRKQVPLGMWCRLGATHNQAIVTLVERKRGCAGQSAKQVS